MHVHVVTNKEQLKLQTYWLVIMLNKYKLDTVMSWQAKSSKIMVKGS